MARRVDASPQSVLPDLRTARGFAVLLYSYLVVAFLLTFSAATLMLSSLDARQAERALTQQQAFWAAEGELEAAIVQIQTATPPSLSDGECVPYTSSTLSTTSDITSAANLCGLLVAHSLYRLDSTGTAQNATDQLSLVVSFASRPTFRFQYLSYSGYSIYTSYGAETGSMDTRTDGRLLTVSNFDQTGGTMAVPQNTPTGSYTRRIKAPCYGQVYGDAMLKAGADLNNSLMIDWHSGGRIWGNLPERNEPGYEPGAYLPSIPVLPEVDIPQEATSLGSALQLGRGQQRCLAPGIYKANRLYLEEGAELCTTGKVELYLTGTGTGSSWWDNPVIRIDRNSKLYGQPEGSAAYARQYSPQDLLIAAKGGTSVSVASSRAAAVIYAPTANVDVRPTDSSSYGVFFGAVLAGGSITNQGYRNCSDGAGTKSYIIYDRALGNLDMPIGRSPSGGGGSGSGVTVRGWVDP
ncbi:MAG: hypothetical protein A2Z92_01250 [Omnitrophica WOR_2 bacterium GWA2_63_20]|nr:MAG: hypothetical protein A2Z92_01250 [Omnitrophica WOR_2 bacterium GWA2_63_20]